MNEEIILKAKFDILDEVLDFLISEWGDIDDIEELFDEVKELLKAKYGVADET
jgi:hypothetical protein